MNQEFVFRDKSAAFYRNETKHLRGFKAKVQWLCATQGVRQAFAISIGRKIWGPDYNEFMAEKHPSVQHMQRKPTQAMSIPGVRVIGG